MEKWMECLEFWKKKKKILSQLYEHLQHCSWIFPFLYLLENLGSQLSGWHFWYFAIHLIVSGEWGRGKTCDTAHNMNWKLEWHRYIPLIMWNNTMLIVLTLSNTQTHPQTWAHTHSLSFYCLRTSQYLNTSWYASHRSIASSPSTSRRGL